MGLSTTTTKLQSTLEGKTKSHDKDNVNNNTICVKKYYKHFYAHRFGNLDELDQFHERHKLPKLLQDEI